MQPNVIAVGPKDQKLIRENDHRTMVNATSHSRDWSVGLSPFLCGPCHLYGEGKQACFGINVENSWQFSKVYAEHNDNGKPNKEWKRWSNEGFRKKHAERYPMGKGARPLYSWDGSKPLTYVQARIDMYIPLYQQAVRGTEAFWMLHKLAHKEPLMLWDFDGYCEPSASWAQIVTNDKKKMGHAFVLQMMLMMSPFFDKEDLK